MTKVIEIAATDGSGSFKAYCAAPVGQAQAGIVVVQEIFGINAGIRRKCDKLAEAGYLAIAPDLFWRIAPETELDPDIKPELDRGFELMNQFDQDLAIDDLKATISACRSHLDPLKKVGVVGYCLGGRLAFMTATRTDVDASVGYYGVGIDGLLSERSAISHPVLLHIGQNDQLVSVEAQAKMHAGLDAHPLVTLYDYPGVDHGFATEFGTRRSDAAATLADERTASFFAQHLR